MNVCVIPARGGSTRIPNKNIKPFLGRPIITYPISVAQKSGLFDKIVVSTDSDEIGGVAAKAGVVYHKRPAEYALPHIPMADAVLEYLESWIVSPPHSYSVDPGWDNVCMLYATATFVTVKLLVEGLTKLEEGYDTVLPVFKGPAVENTFIFRGDELIPRYPEYENEDSSMWIESYVPAGQFYWSNIEALKENRCFTGGTLGGLIVPEYTVHDIDTENDWRVAESKWDYLFGTHMGVTC